ncbi:MULTISPECIES: hypothetical protein [unclassified Eikenella]|uniref:hypothetical protein n=1 Tax=unclassified Eikenella TaxID=2639367 RepID=UPI000B1CA662|nr:MULTISPECIES: hypothetical protein [unclassified Eikenella]
MRAQVFVEKIPFYRGIGRTVCRKRLALGAGLRRFSGSLFPDGCLASRLPEIQTFGQTSRLPLIFALAVPFACYS